MNRVVFGEKLNTPTVICLGFFDSMHIGHMTLVNEAKNLATVTNSQVALFTFSNSHFDVIGKATKQIYTFDDRLIIYKNVGIETVVSAVFDKAFMQMTGKAFLDELFASINVKGVVCGFDYKCGSDFLSADDVENYCEAKGISCKIVDSVQNVNGVKISSTLIRSLLSTNDIETANSLLSQNYFIRGQVVHGKGLGRTLGFATANIAVNDRLLPIGVFAGKTNIDGNSYDVLVNIGGQPTFDSNNIVVEVYILNFSQDIYGRELTIEVTKFLRNIVKFNSADELQKQLQQDLQKVKND